MKKRFDDSFFGILDDIVMVLLALVSVSLLVIEYSVPLPLSYGRLFNHIDIIIASIFLVEFFVKLVLAEKKGTYFKGNWWLLFASIPVSAPAAQALRLLRLLRLFRLSKGMSEIHRYTSHFFKKTYFFHALFVWLMIVFAGALSFYGVEHASNPHVHNLFDSFWWTIGAITTAGAGDIYPVTTAGRVVGILLMLVGIGTTGVFTALIASFLIKPKED